MLVLTKQLLASFSNAVNRIAPAGKRLLPKPLQRFILLHVLDVNRTYKSFDDLPSRRFMEHDVLPWLRERYVRILFVGTASYTYHYEEVFRHNRAQFTTIDSNPSAKVWGAPQHIIAPIQAIELHRPASSFDCVVLNGVFGFGVDSAEDMRATLEAVHAVLRPQGLLVLGWNTSRHADPASLGVVEPFFSASEQSPWGPERRFPSETHVYNFYMRRPMAGLGQESSDLETKK
jgi:hypothetical protein